MAQVVRKDIDNLNAEITLTFTPEDYQPKVKAELEKHRKNAQIKGFRKGKTPLGFIRKMYGKAILADIINELLQDRLFKYLTEEKINILGQPLASETQEPIDFNATEQRDYIFKFDIGLSPDLDVKGLNDGKSFEEYKVTIPEETLVEQLNDVRKRAGQRASVDEAVESNDVIAINAEELDGDAAKKEGWATTFNVLVSDITDEYRDAFLGKKKEDKVRFNIYQIEKDKDREFVEKYLLQIQENDENPVIGEKFEGTIADISRIQEAELNQEFFDKVFGEGEVSSEQEAKDKISSEMAKQYDSQADAILFRRVQEYLIESNKVDLPDAFLKRWIKTSNEEATDESIDQEFDNIKDNIRWSLVKSKVREQNDLEVKEEEILEAFKSRVRGYFGNYGDELIILNTANRLMEDKEQVNKVYEELLSDKVFESIKGSIALKEVSVTVEELDEKIKAIQEEIAAQSGNAPELSETTEEEITEDVG